MWWDRDSPSSTITAGALAILLALAAMSYFNFYLPHHYPVVASGRVVDVQGSGRSRRATVEFVTDYGQQVSFVTHDGDVGDVVTVRYDPRSPGDAAIATLSSWYWLFLGGFSILGSVLIFVGVLAQRAGSRSAV